MPTKLIANYLVTNAGYVLQRFDLKDVNPPAPIVDQAGFLELQGHERDTATLHTQHLRQEILRQRQGVAPEQVTRLQQPSAQARLQRVECIAYGCLLNLSKIHVFLPREAGAKRLALGNEPLQDTDFGRDARKCYLHNCLVERDWVTQCGTCANRAVSADQAGFHKLPAGNSDDIRNGAGMGEIYMADRVFGFVQRRHGR